MLRRLFDVAGRNVLPRAMPSTLNVLPVDILGDSTIKQDTHKLYVRPTRPTI